MEASFWGLLWDMFQQAGVALALVYIMLRVRLLRLGTDGNLRLRPRIVMVLFFGGLSILATYNGVRLPSGAMAGLNEMAPMVAGLIGGPVVGTTAGLIGGIHRYLLGDLTALSNAVSLVIAGLAGGLVFVWRNRKVIPGAGAATFALVMGAIALAIILVVSRPLSEAWSVVQATALPVLIATTIGVGLAVSMVNNLSSEIGD